MSLILGIESSCDETSVAVVENGRKVLSNIISSQIDTHKLYGGVVPEIASRKHLEVINSVIKEAITSADITLKDIDAIGVTYAPGLVGALLIGVSAAKALSYSLNIPLIPVHHIRAHICANFIEHPDLEPPFMALVTSGGHSHIILVSDYTDFKVIGQTRDDAAGEAFDKVARVLGLGYPGGPEIDKAAKNGDECAVNFKKVTFGNDNFDFSFSGIKTGVINHIHNLTQKGEDISVSDIAASFQRSVVEVLVDNLLKAADVYDINQIALAGGVASNSRLRQEIENRKGNRKLFYPSPILCTDNAAMTACSAYFEGIAGNYSDLTLNAIPFLNIDLI